MTYAYLWLAGFIMEMILIVMNDSKQFKIAMSVVAGLCLLNALFSVQSYIDEKIKAVKK